MLITANLINVQATLNNFFKVPSVNYIPGQPVTINFQIVDPVSGNRLVAGASGTCSVVFYNTDASQLTVPASMLFNPDDKSMWSVTLTGMQTQNINGGNFIINLDELGDGTKLDSGIINSVLLPVIFDGTC